MALVAIFHGPPLLDQPAQFSTESLKPSRSASCTAKPKSARHSGLMNGTLPRGMPQSRFTTVAPPRPICFIASRSAVIPSLVMFPFIHCHQVCGLADSGGLRKPVSNESASAVNAVRARLSRTEPRKRRRNRIMLNLAVYWMTVRPTLADHLFRKPFIYKDFNQLNAEVHIHRPRAAPMALPAQSMKTSQFQHGF